VKYLQILNATLLALGVTLSVVLGVVCLQFLVYWDQSASLRAQMPFLLQVTAGCVALAAGAAVAFAAQRRSWPGRWLVQGLPGLAIAGILLLLVSLRS